MENFSANVFNNTPLPKKKFLGIKFTPKIVFIILGIIVVIELIFALWNFVSNQPFTTVPVITNLPSVSQLVPRISLTSAENTYKAGEVIPVSIFVDSSGQPLIGADIIVKFDPKILSVTRNDLTQGIVFTEYPYLSADIESGDVAISGITNDNNGVRVSGEFAKINFKAQTAGKTVISIDFQKGTTTHSNLFKINTLENILEKVDNLELIIK